MRLSPWVSTTALFLAEASFVMSSALLHIPSFGRRSDLDDVAWQASEYYGGDLERRSPQATSTSGDLSLSTPDVEKNNNTLTACTTALQTMTNVTNEPGFAVCYNILDWHDNMGGMFQADLRLYQFTNSVGQFAGVPVDAVTVSLTYPNSTQFSILTNAKRSLKFLSKRQSGPTEIQQFSLVGNFKMQLDLQKLNSTELMSLLIPQITLSATVNGTIVTAQVDPSDAVYFVAGQFSDKATPQTSLQAANPNMAQAAIEASIGFVLPGTTFGIFPTGLIVTGTWCFLFIVAFGLGTVGRIRHREIYRKRVAATSGRGGKR